MRRAVALGIAAGVSTALVAAILATAARCIDSPAFYNLWPLVSGGGGVAAVVASLLSNEPPRLVRFVLMGIGIVLLAGGLALAPFKACAQFSM
jgi:hypothetical protein